MAEIAKPTNVAVSFSGMHPSTPAPLKSGDDVMVMLIERLARDPNIDIDRIERFVDLRHREKMREAEAAFNTAMAAAQAELVPVARTINNSHTNKKYADLAAISEAALPVMHKHGFGLSFSEFKSQEPNCIGIRCKVTHSGGFSETKDFNIPIDAAGAQGKTNKTPVQAYGSTTTYGRRYATCMVFNIATKDDVDGNGPKSAGDEQPISPQQIAELEALIKGTGTDLAKFLAIGEIDSLSEITIGNFPRAKSDLLARQAHLAKAVKS